MKRLKLLAITALLTLISFTCMAQNNQIQEITVIGSVYEIDGELAEITTTNFSKHLKIDAETLEVGKEYRFRLMVSEIEKNEKWCSGCTGVLRAQIIGYSLTPRQVKKDALAVDKIPIGYSKSPRHH